MTRRHVPKSSLAGCLVYTAILESHCRPVPILSGVCVCVCRKTLVSDAARELEKSKMARFDEKSGNLYVTELGRVASHFYIKHSSIVMYNDLLKRHMSEAEVQQLCLQPTIGLNLVA